jgi:hypothetical protein
VIDRNSKAKSSADESKQGIGPRVALNDESCWRPWEGSPPRYPSRRS